jgi:uncharacterized protein YndB with AHSA1/START domain
MSSTGTYLEIEGRPALRFERRLPHPPARVWTMITDPDELATWFPARVHLDAWEVGRTLRFTFDGEEGETTGRVLAVEPVRRLALDWEGDELVFELAGTDDGTLLTFTTLLAERDTAARNAAGWDVCLDALTGSTVDAPSTGRTPPWEERYQEYVAAGVPSGAVIPG